jgi:hypothetical protein
MYLAGHSEIAAAKPRLHQVTAKFFGSLPFRPTLAFPYSAARTSCLFIPLRRLRPRRTEARPSRVYASIKRSPATNERAHTTHPTIQAIAPSPAKQDHSFYDRILTQEHARERWRSHADQITGTAAGETEGTFRRPAVPQASAALLDALVDLVANYRAQLRKASLIGQPAVSRMKSAVSRTAVRCPASLLCV